MKTIIRQSEKKAAFTIVELLTVMSIIVILIGLLVPGLNKVKQYARGVRQKAQFHSIEVAMDLFNTEHEGYPESEYTSTPDGYCGAMKLCEAMMGQDLLGFHPSSVFRSDGQDAQGNQLYNLPTTAPTYSDNLKARKGPYLQLENANAHRLGDLFDISRLGPFNLNSFVLCDVYKRVTNLGTGGKAKIGMPILYYRANTSNTLHDPNNLPTPVDDRGNIYNYYDNHFLVALGMPWEPAPPAGPQHKLFGVNEPQGYRFYRNTRNYNITATLRPLRADSYILISAGYDGEYGTPDDICNFEWKYRD